MLNNKFYDTIINTVLSTLLLEKFGSRELKYEKYSKCWAKIAD